jgi:hypothetical protein
MKKNNFGTFTKNICNLNVQYKTTNNSRYEYSVTLSIGYFLPNKLFKKRIFCLCFITYMGHLNLGNIPFMFHHIHGTFKFREFCAAASNLL